jgi:hypothetical protein
VYIIPMTSSIIDSYLEQAFPLCMELPRQKKHVSFILHKNRIVATGRNFFKTHPKAKVIGYPFDEMHSELDAYRKVPYNLRDKKLTLLNVRFNRFGDLRMAKPCELCLPWCKEIFNEIHYTTDQGIISL